MSASKVEHSAANLAEILKKFHEKGVRLWSDCGQLRYRALKGTLTSEEIEWIKAVKGQIVTLLETTGVAPLADAKLKSAPRFDLAPLAFSQLAHWHLYDLKRRPSLCIALSATRIRGQLQVEELQESFLDVVRRHDALRTRIVIRDGIPAQEVTRSSNYKLQLDDLRECPACLRESEVDRRIAEQLLRPINVSKGDPLYRARLFQLTDSDYVLAIAIEHMVSDGFSLNVLSRDILGTYGRLVRTHTTAQPVTPYQFTDYAIWQKKTYPSWKEKHAAYWRDLIASYPRLRFPSDRNVAEDTTEGWGFLRFKIDNVLKRQLTEWSRINQTTLVMRKQFYFIKLMAE